MGCCDLSPYAVARGVAQATAPGIKETCFDNCREVNYIVMQILPHFKTWGKKSSKFKANLAVTGELKKKSPISKASSIETQKY